MNNTGLMIGLIWFYIISQVCCNFYGGRAMYDNVDIQNEGATNYTITTGADSQGTSITWIDTASSVWDWIKKLFAFDYACFQEADGSPNDFFIFRILLIGISVVLWIDVALTLRRLVTGSG